MTSRHTTQTAPQNPPSFRLPDIPEKHPDDMTSFKHLGKTATWAVSKLTWPIHRPPSYPANVTSVPYPEVPCVTLTCWWPSTPTRSCTTPTTATWWSLQGKPPELALEVASRHTWRADIEVKPDFYASLGIREYWRFDETGEFHGTRLSGDRLIDGQYHPVTVDELPDGELRGYSEPLGLYVCWRQGRLDWYDPSTEDYIPSLESERRLRQQAEERIRQLEAELRQRG